MVDFPKRKSLHKFTTTATVKPKDNPEKSKDCYRCGAKHKPDQCRFKSEKFHACGKHGHISRVCQSKKKLQTSKNESSSQPTNQVIELTSSTTDYTLFPVVVQYCQGNSLVFSECHKCKTSFIVI